MSWVFVDHPLTGGMKQPVGGLPVGDGSPSRPLGNEYRTAGWRTGLGPAVGQAMQPYDNQRLTTPPVAPSRSLRYNRSS